jgi:hypothetical protein
VSLSKQLAGNLAALAAPLAAALLAGCSSAPTLFTPDGRATSQVSCQTPSGDYDECANQAQALCGTNGYDVLRRDSQGANRSLLIACRAPG